MKKSATEGGQSTADPKVDTPPTDSPSDPPTNRDDIQSSPPFFPPEIKERIICFVPPEQRLVFAGIDRPWRNAFTGSPYCWRDIRHGRNANFYSTAPPAFHRADFFPLTHVEHVKFTPAYPAIIQLWQGAYKKTVDFFRHWGTIPNPIPLATEEIPYPWLGLVLKHGRNLERLDLSLMSVGDVALFGSLWSDVEQSQLISLKLPKDFFPTRAFLKVIAEKHKSLEHLSLFIASYGISSDTFEGFTSLKSLSVVLSPVTTDVARNDRCQTIDAVLNQLQIESLQLTCDSKSHLFRSVIFPNQVTAPRLLESLVHLRIEGFVETRYVEQILTHCHLLKTLHLDRVDLDRVDLYGDDGDADDDDIEDDTDDDDVNDGADDDVGDANNDDNDVDNLFPLIQSHQIQISPALQSVMLGFTSQFNIFTVHRLPEFRRLLNVVNRCPITTDIEIKFTKKDGSIGFDLPLSPLDLSFWPKVTSVGITLGLLGPQAWPVLKSALAHLVKLKDLTLKILENSGWNSWDVTVEDFPAVTPVLRPLDSLVLTVDNIGTASLGSSEFRIQEILSRWSRIGHFSLKVYAHENLEEFSTWLFGAQCQFPLRNPVPAIQGLEEFHLDLRCRGVREEFEVSRPTIPGTAWASLATLKNLKVLILEGPLRLEADTFPTIVASTPQLERFQSAVKDRLGKGLFGLAPNDLLAIRGWKSLRSCLLTIDVNRREIASDQPPQQPPLRMFLKLRDSDFVPQLEKSWKEELHHLELMDVSCRVIVGDSYEYFVDNDDYDDDGDLSRARFKFSLLSFGSKCDCGQIHFHIVDKDFTAKCQTCLQPQV